MKITALDTNYKTGELPSWMGICNLQHEIAYNLDCLESIGYNLLGEMGSSQESKSLAAMLDLIETWKDQLNVGADKCSEYAKKQQVTAMPRPNLSLALAAQQFAWFESMCLQVHKIVKADTPNSSALAVLEMGADIGTKLVIQYGTNLNNEALTPEALTSLPPALTTQQTSLFLNKYDPPVLTNIASKFLTYTGQEVYNNAVAGPQAKEFLDMASKNIAEFVAYAGKISEIATEAQARIALAKALYNQTQVKQND